MLRDAGMTKKLVQGYTMQRKHMETNRRFVRKNTGEGAGTQWNLLATGGSLKSIPEVDDEVPLAISYQNVTEADLDEQGRGDGREHGQIRNRSWEFRCDNTVHNIYRRQYYQGIWPCSRPRQPRTLKENFRLLPCSSRSRTPGPSENFWNRYPKLLVA